jgi:hypothetical protein
MKHLKGMYIWSFTALLLLAIIAGLAILFAGNSTGLIPMLTVTLDALYIATLLSLLQRNRTSVHLVRISAAVFLSGAAVGIYKAIANTLTDFLLVPCVILALVSVVYLIFAGRCVESAPIRETPHNFTTE